MLYTINIDVCVCDLNSAAPNYNSTDEKISMYLILLDNLTFSYGCCL